MGDEGNVKRSKAEKQNKSTHGGKRSDVTQNVLHLTAARKIVLLGYFSTKYTRGRILILAHLVVFLMSIKLGRI